MDELKSVSKRPIVGPNTFGMVLKQGLHRRRIMQKDFAKMAGVSSVQVSYWINKTIQPKQDTLAKIWVALSGYMIVEYPYYSEQRAGPTYFAFDVPCPITDDIPEFLEKISSEELLSFFSSHMNSTSFSFQGYNVNSTLETPKKGAKVSPRKFSNRRELLHQLITDYLTLEEYYLEEDRKGIESTEENIFEKLNFIRESREQILYIYMKEQGEFRDL